MAVETMEAEVLGAIRFLHNDGQYGIWIACKAQDRATVEWAMNKLCQDRSVLGFERRDISKEEFDRIAKECKHIFTFEKPDEQRLAARH